MRQEAIDAGTRQSIDQPRQPPSGERSRPRSCGRPPGHSCRDRGPRTALPNPRQRLWRRARSVRGGARAADRDRHRQERACRPQDRGDARFDRYAGAVRPPGRSQPRRSRHDRRRGCNPRLVEFRRDRRTGRHHRLFAPVQDPARRDHRRARLDASPRRPTSCCCCRSPRRPARWGWHRPPRRR